jgi:Rha family phage regulatory protein
MNLIDLPQDAVTLKDDQPITTSLRVAESFGKRHDDVLKRIKSLDCSESFRLRNFAETVYHRENPSGGAPIATPMVEMTRDGFVFLCMGFTGAKAAAFKEAYIARFNEMETALRNAIKEEVATENERLRQSLLAANPALAALVRYYGLPLSIAEVGRLLGLSAEATRTRLKKAAELGLIDYQPDPFFSACGRKAHAFDKPAPHPSLF